MAGSPNIPPPPPGYGYSSPQGGGYAPAVYRPYSGLAITAFVLSLLGCTSPIGFILGVVAVFSIGRDRRGRGLALAAIPISLAFMAGGGWVLLRAGGVVKDWMEIGAATESLLRDGGAGRTPDLVKLRELSTPEFAALLTDENVAAWLAAVQGEFGRFEATIVEFSGSAQSDDDVSLTETAIPARFEKGREDIVAVGRMRDWRVKLDGLSVGVHSLGKPSGKGPARSERSPRAGDETATEEAPDTETAPDDVEKASEDDGPP